MPETTLPDSPALARVARGDLCAGCGACAALAPGKIAMHLETPGYLRPRQSAALAPGQEAAIAAVCPGLRLEVADEGRPSDPLWGPYLAMETGWASDPALRFAASSGGGLSALLTHLLDSGTVDAVLQTGADPALPIGNIACVSHSPDEIAAAAGSRYAPSAPLADLPAQLRPGKTYAFVGKPCDAAALRAMQARDRDLADQIPVVLSFFCAGVPSHRGVTAVLSALGTTLDETAAFRFRGQGWPGRATATAQDGTERSMSYSDSWGGILNRHVQHRCKICADGTGMAADIVCADAWETDAKGYPILDEAPGVSLIVTRTAKGADLLAAARAAGALTTQDFHVPDLTQMQPGQRFRRRGTLARILALRLLGRPVPRYRGLRLVAAARQNSLMENLRNFGGTLRRALRPTKGS